MIVEDELIIAKNLERKLKKLNYDVVEIASSMPAAIAAVEQYTPDLVLMDIVLKGEASGLEASAMIQTNFGTPVIYVTAFTDRPTLTKIQQIGGYGFIPKPFELHQIDAAIQTALGQHQKMQQLQRQATRDALTGVANRACFLNCAQHYLARAQRYGETFTVMMFDIDHFKQVNDTYGHAGGDYVLKVMTALVQSNLRQSDQLGRLGGEEFVALLAHTSVQAASLIAEWILQTVAQTPMSYGDQTFHITTSIGLTPYKPEDLEFATMLERADLALYQAKHKGRNRLAIRV